MPIITSIQDLINKYTPFGNTPPPAPPVHPAERWSKVPYGALQIYKTDYSTGQPESQAITYDTALNTREWGRTGVPNPQIKESIKPSLLHAIYDASKMDSNLRITPEDMVALIAQEGRADLGANAKDVTGGWSHNPRAVDLAERLQDMGYDKYDAGTAALMLDKQMTAARLSKRQNKNIPWQAVWNGLGETKTGRTGYDYAREYGMNAKNVGVNKEALEIIRRHMSEPR
jgi:hypothetical protein